jgi:hypothetical protein
MTRVTSTLEIARRWDGVSLSVHEHARVSFACVGDVLQVDVDAPFYADEPPKAQVGSTDRLWEHEVIELFIADGEQHYLEIELGPHGHYLVLELQGVRRPIRTGLPIEYTSTIVRSPHETETGIGRFTGHARVPVSYLPAGACRANAYAIHGEAAVRCYHAHASLPAIAPDFHRLDSFVRCAL